MGQVTTAMPDSYERPAPNDALDFTDPARLTERTLRLRGVEAVIWGMPPVVTSSFVCRAYLFPFFDMTEVGPIVFEIVVI